MNPSIVQVHSRASNIVSPSFHSSLLHFVDKSKLMELFQQSQTRPPCRPRPMYYMSHILLLDLLLRSNMASSWHFIAFQTSILGNTYVCFSCSLSLSFSIPLSYAPSPDFWAGGLFNSRSLSSGSLPGLLSSYYFYYLSNLPMDRVAPKGIACTRVLVSLMADLYGMLGLDRNLLVGFC